MNFQRATTHQDILRCQDFLRKIYNEELNYTIAIPDQYDHSSSHYLYCEQDGIVAATLRIVTPGAVGMPMEQVCKIPPQVPSIRYAEISRIAVHPNFRGKVLHAEMYANVCRIGKEIGLTHFVAEVDMPLVTLYKRFFCYTPLGAAAYDPDMLKKPEDIGRPNVLPMIGAIDTFLRRFAANQLVGLAAKCTEEDTSAA